MEKTEIEFWLAINSDGEFEIDKDCADDAGNAVGGHNRVFHIKLTVPLPVAAAIEGELPDKDGPLTLKIE